jgi:hypothetical protein
MASVQEKITGTKWQFSRRYIFKNLVYEREFSNQRTE